MSYYLRFLHWPAVGEERVNFVGEDQRYRIFEIPDSSATDTAIKIQVKGRTVATSRYIALDRDGVAYIFDNDKKQLLGSMGACEILENEIIGVRPRFSGSAPSPQPIEGATHKPNPISPQAGWGFLRLHFLRLSPIFPPASRSHPTAANASPSPASPAKSACNRSCRPLWSFLMPSIRCANSCPVPLLRW